MEGSYDIYMGFPGGSAGKESTCNAGDMDSIPGLRRSPGEGKSYPLQYSGEFSPEFSVHGVAKSRTRRSHFHFHFIWYISVFRNLDLEYWRSYTPSCSLLSRNNNAYIMQSTEYIFCLSQPLKIHLKNIH